MKLKFELDNEYSSGNAWYIVHDIGTGDAYYMHPDGFVYTNQACYWRKKKDAKAVLDKYGKNPKMKYAELVH